MNKEKNGLELLDLKTGERSPMPIDDVGPLIKPTALAAISRQIFLTRQMSKLMGFLLGHKSTSKFLNKTGAAKKISRSVAERYRELNYATLNEAFHHRFEERQLYPLTGEIDLETATRTLSAPADSYLNIRYFSGNEIELYPELKLDLKAMIGEENTDLFTQGGTFILFTLKPFHDHTMDYPFRSQVLTKPVEKNPKKRRVYSTDLNFAQFISEKKQQTIFDQNHRVVTRLRAVDYLEDYIYVEVGAICVNSIEQDNCKEGLTYERGQQKAHFNFGSTVILLLPKSFTDKLYFPRIFLPDQNTSVHIQRRNVIALPKDCPAGIQISIADQVKLVLENENFSRILHENSK